ncbi:MAG: OsmC family protein [Nitrospirota bacterium]|nr:OsmC family protein [Nitrospirota bacterium]
MYNQEFRSLKKGMVFTERMSGCLVDYDPTRKEGCVPTDTLLVSIAGCLAIDVVTFLRKMKVEITGFEIEISGQRNPTPPQYFKSVEMVIHISGKNITSKKLDRAISLSQEKYCSVSHTLRKDTPLKVSYVIGDAKQEKA